MTDETRTPDELRKEIQALRCRVALLEAEEARRTNVEAQLRGSQQLLEALANAINGIIWEVDPQTFKLTFVSKQAELLLGYPLDRWLAEPDFWQNHLHPEDRAWAVSFCLEAMAAKHPHEMRYRMLAADGRVVWLRDLVTVIVENDRPVALRGFAIDITRQMHTELALRQNEEKYRTLVETTDTGFNIIDAEGRVLDANAEYVRLTGHHSLEEIRGRRVVEWTAPHDLERNAHEVRKCFEKGFVRNLEVDYIDRDGRVIPIEINATIITTDQGPRVLSLCRDITERKRAQEKLRDSEELHRLISELTSDYGYTCRVLPDGQFWLDSATEGFTRVTGYTVAEVQSRGGWASFIHPDDLPFARAKEPQIHTGERAITELRIVTKSGVVRWIRYSTHPILHPAEKRVVRLVGAVQDITERKRAEEELQDNAKRLQTLSRRLLEVQEQERRYLAREIHDEIGQLVTGLKLALDMGVRSNGVPVGGALAKAQEILKELTAQIRDLSLRLRPMMLDDLGLLPALLWQFERYAAQTKIYVHFEHRGIERRFQPEVETAAYRIVQEGLTNIARHASVDEATVRVWLDAGQLLLQIEDRGAGFNMGTALAGGRSTGLSGMLERATLLGGQLDVETEIGRGTRLTAGLPIHLREEHPSHGHNTTAGR